VGAGFGSMGPVRGGRGAPPQIFGSYLNSKVNL
jgi:hypothetical protein